MPTDSSGPVGLLLTKFVRAAPATEYRVDAINGVLSRRSPLA